MNVLLFRGHRWDKCEHLIMGNIVVGKALEIPFHLNESYLILPSDSSFTGKLSRLVVTCVNLLRDTLAKYCQLEVTVLYIYF